MTTTPIDPFHVNMANSELFRRGEGHAHFRELRHHNPIAWNESFEIVPGAVMPGFWSITKYADIVTISRNTDAFISSEGIVMGQNRDTAGPQAGLGKMLITMDPPRHVRLRRLVNKGFTPRAVAAMEDHVRQITTSIIDDICERGSCDFVTDAAALLPLAVICGMMGVERKDWDLMFRLTNMVLGADDPEYQEADANTQDTSFTGHMRMFQFFMQQLAERRRQRRDDLVSLLIDADVDGDKLSDEEILYFCYLLILAGNETTRNAISGGLAALCEHPEQRQRLQADPSLMPSAIEEILRWTSPVMHMARMCVKDTVVGGVPVKERQQVVLWYPSANRDEDVFPDGDVFNIARSPNDHIAFGIGEHFCLGAGFARLELRVMFEELLRRLPDIQLDGEYERLRSTFIGGIKHMPVRFTPAGRA